ncbi:MAG: dNTP triphosphohydrolase [Thermomicrobiales bacterium]|nr:dNTP triphosphohydrolase [Thermomicrobiales bacterium]
MSIAPSPLLTTLHRAARRGCLTDQPGTDCFRRDRDVLLAAPEFARLRDVTQVMAPGGPGEFQTRHSHSLQVARIARSLAESLHQNPVSREVAEQAGGLNPDVVEAAALAHDLGHPPFGHDAEDELDRLLLAAGVADGFEANAQSFRVVCALGGAGAPWGFDLTRATLASILKYPWLRGGNLRHPGKWGAYASEAETFRWVLDVAPTPGRPSLEARVMDWADLLAYAVDDFEDFVRSGDLPLARLRASSAERDWLLGLIFARRGVHASRQDTYAQVLDRLLKECPRPGDDASRARAALRSFANRLVAEAIAGVRLQGDHDGTARLITAPEPHAVIMLTEGLTWHYVIDSPLLAPMRAEQRRIIREVFLALADAVHNPARWGQLPPALRARLAGARGEPEALRLVADAIAAMPERDAVAYHARLAGG